VLEPFGAHLRSKFVNPTTADKYAFDSLYTTTQTLAKQDVNKNRFTIKGKYSSSSSADISLNALNVPQGSVKVTAGGASLTENVDYTVDYNLGRVKIINDGILQSGTPIKISLESQSLFNIQTKTMMGTRLDYKFSDKFNIGGTIIKLSERPLTPKINLGDEPINNTIYGFDITYSTDAPFLTRWADKLPIYSTKEKSTLTVEGEFAQLLPGNPSAIGKTGTSYLDDFEGSQSTIDLSTISMWNLASTPQNQPDLFPEGDGLVSNTLAYGFNRAKLAWYVIDPLFWRNDFRTPSHVSNNPNMQSNHYMREVLQTEVFPNKSLTNNIITNMPILDLAFYPNERGPYNFDDGTSFGAGIAPDGTLVNPSTRWGGVMRRIETTDFESSNVEFIQFWIMDPFNDEDGNPAHGGGQLYFNLGNISEDILKDSRKSFENGLPISAIDYNTGANINLVDTTTWGRVPKVQALVNAFDNTPSTRPFQDIGYDGFNDVDEAAFFGSGFGTDPSADNYHHYRGTDYDNASVDILTRYKQFNGPEGNSPTSAQYNESYSTSATTRPNVEDINLNNNLDFKESYYQYAVNLSPSQVNPNNVGNNYITNVLETSVRTQNGETRNIRWYQFKIPIREPEKIVGNIQDFKSIRFMRMVMKGFNEKVILRFAQLELVRGEWRKYDGSLLSLGDYIGTDDNTTSFIISAVNIEENSSKTPVNYVIPPEILREINPNPTSNNSGLNQLNEQALSLSVCNLKDGDARAGFKIMDIDIRRYKKLKMFIHAEQSNPTIPLNDNDLTVFIRLGTDFNNNYYEYEVPLKVTSPGYYNKDIENDQYIVWPSANNIDIQLSQFTDIKLKRNQLMSDPQSGVNIIKAYEEDDGDKKIKVKGNPNLAEVRVFMIGVRNNKQSSL
ncbi:MAG: cell surface protein SprA, partial [Bacteroidia bacterium]|nr:cell surface protein SprA [Bacteroidia bacterium]